MKNKTILVLYCLFVGMLGLFTRMITPSMEALNVVRFMVASLFIIGGIYYWCYQMFIRELKYEFRIRPFLKKGMQVGALVGIFTGLSVALQFLIFGNEILEGNLALIKIDPRIKPEHLQEAIDGAYLSNSWWVLSAKQFFFTLATSAFYSVIVAALFSFHPDRIKVKK